MHADKPSSTAPNGPTCVLSANTQPAHQGLEELLEVRNNKEQRAGGSQKSSLGESVGRS